MSKKLLVTGATGDCGRAAAREEAISLTRIKRASIGAIALASMVTSSVAAAHTAAQPAPGLVGSPVQSALLLQTRPAKHLIAMSDEKTSTGVAEMNAAKALTTRVLAIGTWTAKGTPESRPAIMPAEARDTMRLMLAGKIDQWFAKIDGSGAVFLLNVTDPAEAHALLEQLPLGQADMMRFELIPVGPLWPLGLLLREPAK